MQIREILGMKGGAIFGIGPQGRLADAVELARRQAIGSDMRDSARFVEDNRLGQSLDRQKAIDAKLDELLDILSNRREQLMRIGAGADRTRIHAKNGH